MLRALSMFALGGGFLMISPKLRLTLMDNLNTGVISMDAHAPYSYAGLVMLILLCFFFSLSRGAQPR